MNETNNKMLLIIVEFLFLSLSMIIAPLAIYNDIIVLNDTRLTENSTVEWLQILFLFTSATAFVKASIKDKEQRGFYTTLSTLFIAMFIRETDNYLDLIVHGFWKYLVTITFIIGIIVVIKNKGTFLKPLVKQAELKPFTFIIVGLIIVLILSRILGTGTLWEPIMSQLATDYNIDTIKNVIQESIELSGYLFITYGSFLQTRPYR